MPQYVIASLEGRQLVYLCDVVEPWERVVVRRAGHPDLVLFDGRGAGARSGCVYRFAGKFRRGTGEVEITPGCLGTRADVGERLLRETLTSAASRRTVDACPTP